MSQQTLPQAAATPTLADSCARLLETDPDHEAIQFEGRWLTWGEVRRMAADLRAALAATEAGPQAPVTLVSRNLPSVLAALIALLADGRTVRMVYAFQSPAALSVSLERLGSPVAVMTTQDFSPEVRDVMRTQGAAGVVLGEMSAAPLEGFERTAPRADLPQEAEPCIVVLTSGTTGAPKPFALPHRVIAEFVGGHLPGGPAGHAGAEPPLLLTFPIGNIAGIFFAASSILSGKRTILLDRFSIAAWRDYLVKHRPAVVGAPTAAIAMILDEQVPPEELTSVRYLITGAAPLDETVHRAFQERYGVPILLSYGATEFGGPVTSMTPDLHARFGDAKLGSVGRPLPGVMLRVLGPETSAELGPGEEGIVEVVSPRVGPEWIRTSDLGVIDADGFFWHRGRADGAIIRGGFKVLPETIERALLQHPAVSAAGVVGVADRRLQQVPAAVIQLKPGAPPVSAEALEQHLRAHVLATHIPVRWRFVESLPITPAFKVDRVGLKRLFEEP
jgi:acyl-coenzyme A synthetase/AMP-(fatty) acid ligase